MYWKFLLLNCKMNILLIFLVIFVCFGEPISASEDLNSNSVSQLTRRIEFLEKRFNELSVRCSNLIKLKRGFPGPIGKQGVPGRDGLNGLSGRDGPPGRDGRDCPCKNGDLVEYFGNNYANAFTGRSKRTIGQVPLKNVTVTRFGRHECPRIEGMKLTLAGRTTIDYSDPHPNYQCSPLDEIAVGKKAPISNLFPAFDMVSSRYSVKYRTNQKSPFAAHNLDGAEVPCATCVLNHVETALMFQGISKCPEDWNIVYDGYLMSENWNHIRSENICVDKEAKKSGAPNFDGLSATLSSIHAKCHGKACGTDMDDESIKCVVCVLHRNSAN